jgi:hypothetical protein
MWKEGGQARKALTSPVMLFLIKIYINTKSYQLHLVSATTQYLNGSTDAHTQKTNKRKDPLRYSSTSSNSTTTTKTTSELQSL